MAQKDFIPLPLWNSTVTSIHCLGRTPTAARNPHHKPYVLIVMKIQDCGAQDRTVTEAKSNGTKGLGIE